MSSARVAVWIGTRRAPSTFHRDCQQKRVRKHKISRAIVKDVDNHRMSSLGLHWGQLLGSWSFSLLKLHLPQGLRKGVGKQDVNREKG